MTVYSIISYNGGVFYLVDSDDSSLTITNLNVNYIETIYNGGVIHSFHDASYGSSYAPNI